MSEILLPLITGFLCIGLAFLALVGVIVFLYINHTRSREKMVVPPSWPGVPGKVTVARMVESVRTRVDDDAFYSPYIEFEYNVADHSTLSPKQSGRWHIIPQELMWRCTIIPKNRRMPEC